LIVSKAGQRKRVLQSFRQNLDYNYLFLIRNRRSEKPEIQLSMTWHPRCNLPESRTSEGNNKVSTGRKEDEKETDTTQSEGRYEFNGCTFADEDPGRSDPLGHDLAPGRFCRMQVGMAV
jgi:hypothetical protein